MEKFKDNLPNFFIIGAPKCGTTSLAKWLSEHPNIYMSPIKEPFYYSSDIKNQKIRTFHEYKRLFEGVTGDHSAIGEASTTYLYSQVAVPNIEETLEYPKYIIMIRNPVDMAYSLHGQQLVSFNENIRSFPDAWALAEARQKGEKVPPRCKDPKLLDYPGFCSLGTLLERLFGYVERDRVLILVLDDVRANPRNEYLKVLDFLGVKDDGRINFPVYNQAKAWRSLVVGRFVRYLAVRAAYLKHVSHILPKRSLGLIDLLSRFAEKPRDHNVLNEEFRHSLLQYFSSEIDKLEILLDRDFSDWRRL